MNGGAQVAQILQNHGVKKIFTLCGGHISPILVESKKRGIQIVDVRHEANAAFAADASSRVSGVVGVAAVVVVVSGGDLAAPAVWTDGAAAAVRSVVVVDGAMFLCG